MLWSKAASTRTRERLARGLERACAARPNAALSAAVPVDRQAVRLARPQLQQLARALRAPGAVDPSGVELARTLLTDPCSPLYRPAYREQLYEAARAALFALHQNAVTK